MKIIFLCGSLEPGCDGVGDYTRRLAGELIRQGHQASIVSLNDKFIKEVSIRTQISEGIELSTLRLPSETPVQNRIKRAKGWIDEENPDWLSLQYVPFSFHSKGLPFRLSSALKKLGKFKNWHIMFHELWVGMDLQASMKHTLWGQVQRQLVKSLIKNIKPDIIHTQTRLYQAQLKRLGYNAVYLQLFGNIPLFNDSEVCNISRVNNRSIVLVIFGTIHPGAPVVSFAEELAFFSEEHQLEISFKMIGRCGKEQQIWCAILQSNGFDVEVLGEQPSIRISEILTTASIGVSTTPLAQIEKSGTVAAMLEHGLQVLCVARPWSPKEVERFSQPLNISEYRKGNLKSILVNKEKIPLANTISKVAHQFIDVLSAVK